MMPTRPEISPLFDSRPVIVTSKQCRVSPFLEPDVYDEEYTGLWVETGDTRRCFDPDAGVLLVVDVRFEEGRLLGDEDLRLEYLRDLLAHDATVGATENPLAHGIDVDDPVLVVDDEHAAAHLLDHRVTGDRCECLRPRAEKRQQALDRQQGQEPVAGHRQQRHHREVDEQDRPERGVGEGTEAGDRNHVPQEEGDTHAHQQERALPVDVPRGQKLLAQQRVRVQQEEVHVPVVQPVEQSPLEDQRLGAPYRRERRGRVEQIVEAVGGQQRQKDGALDEQESD
jgi:hypothetical protein